MKFKIIWEYINVDNEVLACFNLRYWIAKCRDGSCSAEQTSAPPVELSISRNAACVATSGSDDSTTACTTCETANGEVENSSKAADRFGITLILRSRKIKCFFFSFSSCFLAFLSLEYFFFCARHFTMLSIRDRWWLVNASFCPSVPSLMSDYAHYAPSSPEVVHRCSQVFVEITNFL